MHLQELQAKQPWRVLYSSKFRDANGESKLPYLYATHTVLHAMKSVGKLAAVFEAADHRETGSTTTEDDLVIRAMSADLVTAALRLANLTGFDLEEALHERVKEKNGVGF